MPKGRGTLRVVSPQGLQDAEKVAKALDTAKEPVIDDLAAHVRRKFDAAKRHRTSSGVDLKLITAMRAFNGEYSPEKKAEIRSSRTRSAMSVPADRSSPNEVGL